MYSCDNLIMHRSRDFRPSYGCINEVRALVPEGTPLLACTATVTHGIRKEVIQSLEMSDCMFVSASPNRPNIFYEVHTRSDIATDMEPVVTSLKELKNLAPRVLVYCRTLDMCADLYAHFHYELNDLSYYPPGAERTSDNRLFGMYHASTPQHNKDVILSSLSKPDGVVKVIFATVALGMGINIYEMSIQSSIMEHHQVWKTISKKVEGVEDQVNKHDPLCTGNQWTVEYANTSKVHETRKLLMFGTIYKMLTLVADNGSSTTLTPRLRPVYMT